MRPLPPPTTRRAGLSLLEVLVAASLLAIILVGIASLSGATQTALHDLDVSHAAGNSARATLESFESAPWASLHPYYNGFRQVNPAVAPKVSALFEVRAPGLPAGNQLGSVVVREPTAAEARRYWQGLGPRYAYAVPSNPYAGVSSALPGMPGMSAGTEPKLYMIIVEVNVPGTSGRAPVRIRLQTWRFWL